MVMNHSRETRAAAIADYYAGGGTIQQVAERHGIPRGTFGAWVRKRNELELTGGHWVIDLRRRVQVWEASA